MPSEHDILSRLPEAPPPSPQAEHAAIASALQQFDQKISARTQGHGHDPRLMQQTASSNPPSRRSPAMPRTHHFIAASLVTLMAGSAAWFHVEQHPVVPTSTRVDVGSKTAADPFAAPPPPIASSPVFAQEQIQQATPLVTRDQATESRGPQRALPAAKVETGRLEGKMQAPLASVAPQRDRLAEHAAPTARIAPAEPVAPPEPSGRDKFTSTRRESLQGRARSAGLDLLASTSTPPPIPSCAPRSTAMSCRSRLRCGPRS